MATPYPVVNLVQTFHLPGVSQVRWSEIDAPIPNQLTPILDCKILVRAICKTDEGASVVLMQPIQGLASMPLRVFLKN